MLGTLDFRSVQENSQDVASLRALVQQIVGEPFLCARFSYGDELTLHFGEPRKSRLKKLAHLVQGSYVVAARASSWYFKASGGTTVTVATNGSQTNPPNGFVRLTSEQVEGRQLALPGARIVAADVAVARRTDTAGFTCALLLSDGSSLLIVPETEPAADVDQAAQEVADWEVFVAAHDRYLRVGPGPKWSYLPSR